MNKLEKILDERSEEVAEDLETFEYMVGMYQQINSLRIRDSMDSFRRRLQKKYSLPDERDFKALRFRYWANKFEAEVSDK